MKRYILWGISLIVTLLMVVFAIRSDMIPTPYLVLVILVMAAIFSVLFVLQKKRRIGRIIISACVEVLVCALAMYGISVFYHAENMFQNITEIVVETEAVSAYVMNTATYEKLTDTAGEVFGIVENKGEEAVLQVLDRLADTTETKLITTYYADLFTAADALREGKVQVLLLSDAYAELISGIEGYEWFATEVRVLETSVEEVQIEMPVVPGTEISGEETTESSADSNGESKEETTEDVTSGTNNGQATDSKPGESVKMELMEQPEQVDWNALVTQEMLEAPEGTFVVYISGVDTWGSASTKSRSDVNILAVVNTNTKKILLVSTPRDYYVPLSISGGVKDKLTHAGIYGVNTSKETLEMLYAVDIQYYVRLNFTGFVGIIDALGGVDVYSDSAFSVGDDFSYVEGINHMNGIEALAFARERHSFAGGDRTRGTHQMEVIRAVISKCASSAILYNYAEVMNSMAGCFVTDMSKEKIASLVKMQLTDMAEWSVTAISVDGTGASKTTYTVPEKKAYVMIPDETTVQNAKEQIAAVLNGQ